MRGHLFLVVGILALLLVGHAPGAAAQMTLPTVYVEARDEFANDFSAGVIRKSVPVILTGDHQQAGYVARFTWATNEGSKTRGVMTALATGIYSNGSYERVSMSIIERKSQNLVYSYTCQKGGRHMQSVAECLAKHWKEAIETGKTKMQLFNANELANIQNAENETISVRKAGDTLATQIIEHPTPSSKAEAHMIPPEDLPPESVAEASKRMKAERAARNAKPQTVKPTL